MRTQQWVVIGLLVMVMFFAGCKSKVVTPEEEPPKSEIAQAIDQSEPIATIDLDANEEVSEDEKLPSTDDLDKYQEDADKTTFEYEKDDVKVTMDTGKIMEWPEDIPAYVPGFNGDIVSLAQAQDAMVKSYTLAYENIKDIDLNMMIVQLEKNGWTILMQSTLEEGWTINAMHNEKGAFFMANIHDGNSGALQITFNK